MSLARTSGKCRIATVLQHHFMREAISWNGDNYIVAAYRTPV